MNWYQKTFGSLLNSRESLVNNHTRDLAKQLNRLCSALGIKSFVYLFDLMVLVQFKEQWVPMERKSTQNICACVALDLCVRTI